MNWGHSIILVFIIFAAGIITLVTKSMQTRIDMVTADYYAEELKFQQVIDGQRNAGRLSSPVSVRQQGNLVLITFPEELRNVPVKGQAHFYRPSDSRQDFTAPLTMDNEGKITVPGEHLQKGNYHVKLQWEQGGAAYFQETQIFIQ